MILALDLDGVVLTGHAEGGRWDRKLQEDLGISAEALQNEFFERHWKDVVLGRRHLDDALSECWPRLGCNVRPADFVDYWFAHDFTPDPDVLSLVADWRKNGRHCVLATNQEHRRAHSIWNDRALLAHFDAMYYSAELGVQKPDTGFFREVQKRIAMPPNDIMFLDDFVSNVEAAAAAGWQARHYRDVGDLRAAIAAIEP